MLRLRVLAVGKDRRGPTKTLADDYLARLGRYGKVELLELPAVEGRRSPAESAAQEGSDILARRRPDERLVALDERGALLTSRELAEVVGDARDRDRGLAFVIGGDEGLAPEVRDAADKVLSLSRMTLPHRLARVLLLEQLYRACTILKGEPYHK